MKTITLALALLLGLLLHPHSASAQTTCTAGCVQVGNDDEFSGTSNTVTLTGVTAGNAFHALSCGDMGTGTVPVVGAVTLNGSTTGVQIGTPSTGAPSGGNNYTCVAIAAANAQSGSNTLVVPWSGGTGACAECTTTVEEWHGDSASSILDGSSASYTAGPGAASCSVSTAHAADLVETWLFTLQFSTPTFPSGFSTANSSAGAGAYYSAYDLVASTGTYSPSWTSGAGTFDMYVICAAFKQGSGPPPTGGQFNQLMLHASLELKYQAGPQLKPFARL